jgi:hypothetical protein
MYAVSVYCDVPFSDVGYAVTLQGDSVTQNNTCLAGAVVIYKTPQGESCTQVNLSSDGIIVRSALIVSGDSVIQVNTSTGGWIVLSTGIWILSASNTNVVWIGE